MDATRLFILIFLLPVMSALLIPLFKNRPWALSLSAAAQFLSLLPVLAAVNMARHAPLYGFGRWLFLDAFSALHLGALYLTLIPATLFAFAHFKREVEAGQATPRTLHTFAILWNGAFIAMLLVLLSNNLGLMWVGMEGTTVVTAFLISLKQSRKSLEAMWKYLILCSVGIAFAFMGVLLTAASAKGLHLPSHDVMLWDVLYERAAGLNSMLMKAAFLFLLVGYGTKAGLFPMHSWLPDAHSQAPAPVSALFSGFMLNTSLYCLLRFLPITERATGLSGFATGLLVLFGLLTILIGAAFILFQKDLKRFLAYSSLEHMGLMTLGAGLGGAGLVAALFHMINHALGKTLAFLSAGRLAQRAGGADLECLTGIGQREKLWGFAVFAALLALAGAAPFAFFMSKFQIVKAAFDQEGGLFALLLLLGTAMVFIGVLRYVIPLFWGEPKEGGEFKPSVSSVMERVMVVLPLALLLLLGLWMPAPVIAFFQSAAQRITP